MEDSLEIEGQKKAPDYVFRIGRDRKFFAEAKKPGVDLKADARPAYQLRRYAWTAKLSLSLLTDFEEMIDRLMDAVRALNLNAGRTAEAVEILASTVKARK